MPKWIAISDMVINMLGAAKDFSSGDDLRVQAATLAMKVYGDAVIGAPAIVNVAALTLLMRERVMVHRISRGATRMVHETDLHTLPGNPPRLLRGPWIVEAKDPEREQLFWQTANLAGYPLDDSIFLVGVDYPDGVFVARWMPKWGEEKDLESGIIMDHSPLIDDVDRHHDWAREAARFALVLGLHLDAEGSPLRTDDEPTRQKRSASPGKNRSMSGGTPAWTTRRIYLDRIVTSPRAGSRESVRDEKEALSDRAAATVMVRGHLKRQAYGPGLSHRRWIYVESYEARRWVAPRPMRIEVGVTSDNA